jgi:hypothetical protein
MPSLSSKSACADKIRELARAIIRESVMLNYSRDLIDCGKTAKLRRLYVYRKYASIKVNYYIGLRLRAKIQNVFYARL